MIDNEVARTFDRRSALFLTGGAVLTSALVLRMLQMQVFNYQDYKKKSENNSLRVRPDFPQRGKILGAHGGSSRATCRFIASMSFPKRPMTSTH